MVGDAYSSILQCLVYCKNGYSSSLGDTHPSLKFPSFYVCLTSTGPLLGSSQISWGSNCPPPSPNCSLLSWNGLLVWCPDILLRDRQNEKWHSHQRSRTQTQYHSNNACLLHFQHKQVCSSMMLGAQLSTPSAQRHATAIVRVLVLPRQALTMSPSPYATA